MSLVPPLLPASFSDVDIADLLPLSPDGLLRDPGLLRVPDESTWPARALRYARAGSSDTYDEIGFRFVAATPWNDRLPLQTRRAMQHERDRHERSLQDEGFETLREQQALLRHRPLDLPTRAIDADVSHDGRLLHVLERVDTQGRPRTDAWVFPLSAPPPAVLRSARPADVPLIGSQRYPLDIPGANWIPLSAVIDRGALLRLQEWGTDLVSTLQPGFFHAFISHRWLTPTHPDPDKRQAQYLAWQLVAALCEAIAVARARGLREPRRINEQVHAVVGPAGGPLAEALLVNVLRPTLDDAGLVAAADEVAALETLVADAGVSQAHTDDRLERLRAILADRPVLKGLVARVLLWYDYASMPQQPRSAAEEARFREHLQYLVAIQAVAYTLVLLDEPADYFTRAWCTLEALFARSEVGLCEPLVGSARRTARDGRTERYFTSLLIDHPHIVWRALLDTEVLGVQSPDDCLRRLQLGATDPRDVPYIYDRLCHLHAPRSVHSDRSEVVTGVFPVPIVNEGNDALVPRQQGRDVARHVDRSDPFTIDWSAAIHLASYRQRATGALTLESVPPFVLMEPLAEGHAACHIAVVAGCEGEALLLGRWILDRGAELGRMLDNVTVASLSWLASDVAPVGHIVHGRLAARPVHAQLWAVVAFSARFDACPTTVALTETLRACAMPYLEMRIDEASDNVALVTSRPQSARPRSQQDAGRFALRRLDAAFPSHIGGLFQADVPQGL